MILNTRKSNYRDMNRANWFRYPIFKDSVIGTQYRFKNFHQFFILKNFFRGSSIFEYEISKLF